MVRTANARAQHSIVLIVGAVVLICNPSTMWVGLQRVPPRGVAPGEVSIAAAKDGIFTPLVQGAKVVIGEQQLKEIRAKVIKMHGQVMGDFIDTADTDFGDFALSSLFDAADVDGSGNIDPQELKEALNTLGFSWVDESKAAKIAAKGDLDGDGLIDFEEFKRMAPAVLRQNLMKLAKQNGSDMGLMS